MAVLLVLGFITLAIVLYQYIFEDQNSKSYVCPHGTVCKTTWFSKECGFCRAEDDK